MWVLILLLAVFVALGIVAFVVEPYDDGLVDMSMVVCAIVLLLILMTIPINRADVRTQLAQRDALQQSYTELRENPLEMATVGKDIAKWNAWLARAKYWNGTQWSWWWPDDVNQTKPIR